MKTLRNWLWLILSIKIKKFISTRWEMALIFLKLKTKQKLKEPSNLYCHCSDLPLDRFIDCLIDKKFERLVKFGKVNIYKILSVWENIFIEYCELSGTEHYKKLLSLTREIGAATSKLHAIDTCIYVLTYQYSYYCVTVLQKLGYKYQFNYKDKDSFVADLKMVVAKKKTIELTKMQKQKEYDNLLGNAKGGEINREYYDKQLIMLSKHNGYHIKKSEITVSEFLTMLKILSDEINKSNLKNNEQ